MSHTNYKIKNILEKLKYTHYSGDLRCHHFSVGLNGYKILTPVQCNYFRTYSFGDRRGTFHSEMSTMNYLMNINKCWFNHRDKNHCILCDQTLTT
jgi:hypothetical protein